LALAKAKNTVNRIATDFIIVPFTFEQQTGVPAAFIETQDKDSSYQ
jgi:hypothetical protein